MNTMKANPAIFFIKKEGCQKKISSGFLLQAKLELQSFWTLNNHLGFALRMHLKVGSKSYRLKCVYILHLHIDKPQHTPNDTIMEIIIKPININKPVGINEISNLLKSEELGNMPRIPEPIPAHIDNPPELAYTFSLVESSSSCAWVRAEMTLLRNNAASITSKQAFILLNYFFIFFMVCLY